LTVLAPFVPEFKNSETVDDRDIAREDAGAGLERAGNDLTKRREKMR
jgi:hypothetical protein